jgi:hypothetical protein
VFFTKTYTRIVCCDGDGPQRPGWLARDLLCRRSGGAQRVPLRTDFSLVSGEVETTTISDSGAVITASRQCRSVDAHTAVCPTQHVPSAHMAVGDLDDRVTPEDFYKDMIVDGGPGNDVLRGNDIGSDRLNGGGGQDQLYGGRGDDIRRSSCGSRCTWPSRSGTGAGAASWLRANADLRAADWVTLDRIEPRRSIRFG